MLAKLVSVTVTTPMSNCELPHSEWILLSLQFIANAHELLSMLSFKNKFLQLFILLKLAARSSRIAEQLTKSAHTTVNNLSTQLLAVTTLLHGQKLVEYTKNYFVVNSNIILNNAIP